jgi:replicative DNA helicase
MAEHPMAHRLACDLIFDRNRVAYSGMTTNVTMDRFAQNRLEPWEREAIRKAAATVASWPLLYDVRPGLTIAQIEAITRRAFRKWERQGIAPGLLIIDHLGKVRPSKDRKGSLHAEMADVSGETAEMAKRLGVPVLGLVQLNRQVEARQDKRPILSDLRQAGELEQDARQVIFLHRPEQHLREPVEEETDDEAATRLKKLAEVRNKLWWVVEKNSNGPRGQALTFCEIGCSAVRDWNP